MTGGVSVSEAPTTGLGQLINENRFFVPTHQRDYRWDRDRVEKFIEDLTNAVERQDRFYFVGLMVFMRHSNTDRLRVLDGQQRLATTMVLFSALRAWHSGNVTNSETAKRIQYDFIGWAEYGESKPEPKLSLNRNNDDRFQKYVVVGSPIEEIRGEIKKLSQHSPNYCLLDAIVCCHEYVAKAAAAIGDVEKATAHFAKFIKFIRDNLVVVRLTVPNESNAFRVFETLNDRGMDLSAIDLLKNYLFGLANDDSKAALDQMEHRWSQLAGTLENFRQEDFLKVFWTSRHGRTQLDDIFEAVKGQCKTSADAIDLSLDLLEAAEHYSALDSADDPVWSPHTQRTRDLIVDLQMIGSKQIRPVMLSALKKFSISEFENLLRLLEAVVVRWQLIGEQRTGILEIQFARLAEQIWSGAINTAKEAFSAISVVYPDDASFRAKFEEKEGLTNQKAVYLLRKIEEHERSAAKPASGKELSPHQNLTLEHILPKNPGMEWKEIIDADSKIVDDCALRLGNMCLLTETKNREAARAPFDTKRLIYENSELISTKQVASYPLWNRDNIVNRQQWLAKRATAIWRFND